MKFSFVVLYGPDPKLRKKEENEKEKLGVAEPVVSDNNSRARHDSSIRCAHLSCSFVLESKHKHQRLNMFYFFFFNLVLIESNKKIDFFA